MEIMINVYVMKGYIMGMNLIAGVNAMSNFNNILICKICKKVDAKEEDGHDCFQSAINRYELYEDYKQ